MFSLATETTQPRKVIWIAGIQDTSGFSSLSYLQWELRNHPNEAAVSYTRTKHSHGHWEGPTAQKHFSIMHIYTLRTEVMLPSHPGLLLHVGRSKLILFKKSRFDKLFLNEM